MEIQKYYTHYTSKPTVQREAEHHATYCDRSAAAQRAGFTVGEAAEKQYHKITVVKDILSRCYVQFFKK